MGLARAAREVMLLLELFEATAASDWSVSTRSVWVLLMIKSPNVLIRKDSRGKSNTKAAESGVKLILNW